MRAIHLTDKNIPPVVVEVEPPEIGNDEVMLEVAYAALNHRDLWISIGKYSGIKYPIIPGSDCCGYMGDKRVIVNPGFYWGLNEKAQSHQFQILGLPRNGCFSEFVSVPKEYVYNVPEHLTDVQAAALPLAGLTAFRALFTKCKPVAGETILITGIGGGVALQLMQFALAFGLKVFVSSSDDRKIERAIQLGAIGGVNYNKENWELEILKKSEGFDIIIDSSAGESFYKLVSICSGGARICLYGGTRGLINNLSPQQLFWKQITLYGSSMGTQDEFKEMLAYVEKNKIVPIVDSIYELQDCHRALERMTMNQQFGKIVIKVIK